MTHDEMIELIEAHERGANIEVSKKGKNNWNQLAKHDSFFDFKHFDYRIEPRKQEELKFKAGDTIVCKNREGRFMDKEMSSYHIEKINYLQNTYHSVGFELSFKDEKHWIKIEECLWYWEFWDAYYRTFVKTDRRFTLEEVEEELSDDRRTGFTPLYALGFKLPRGKK